MKNNKWDMPLTRLSYAETAFFLAAFAVSLWFLTLSVNQMDSGNVGDAMPTLALIILTGVLGMASAAICWPAKTKRTKSRMVIAGLCTVALTFFTMGVIVSLFREDTPVIPNVNSFHLFW